MLLARSSERFVPRRRASSQERADDGKRCVMIAAVGLGLIGTVLVVVLVVWGIMFIVRRA